MKFERYEKVYAETPLSNMKLMCKVIEYQEHVNMVLLQLPCTIQGQNKVLVQMDKITRIQPKNERPEPPPFKRSPASNPFRKLVSMIEKHAEAVQSGKIQTKASQQVQIEQPAKELPKQTKYEELIARLTPDQRSILKNLSKEQQISFLSMLK